MGVRGDLESVIPSRADDGFNFLDRELRVLAAFGLAQDSPCGGDLDEMRACLIAAANRLISIIYPIDDTFRGSGVSTQVTA